MLINVILYPFTRRQHVFDITAKPIDVDSNFYRFLLSTCYMFLFKFCTKCKHVICSWQ